MTFFELQKRFPDERYAIDYFIKVRYSGTIACVHCGVVPVYQKKDRPKVFHCAACKNTFSVFKDTIFENSSTDLVKWMYAIHLFLNGKKGISGLQLMREIGVTYKTAWRMLRQIRLAMAQDSALFTSMVEMDEVYLGGKPRKMNRSVERKRKSAEPGGKKTGSSGKKSAVVGVVERKTKQVKAKVADMDDEGKKITAKQLFKILNESAKEGTKVITDGLSAYKGIKQSYIHLRIDHTVQYVKGYVHTNSIESFWSTLQRGIYGIYHSISPKYLQLYVDEFCFRHNNRGNKDVFDLLLKRAIMA
jgi:transposase-like protein